MYVFIISVILVTIISLCVFKNRFWENRYTVLLIITATGLVLTTSVNFIIRNSLPKKAETISSEPLYLFNYSIANDSIPNDSISNDSVPETKSYIILTNYNDHVIVHYNMDSIETDISKRKISDTYFAVSNDNPRYEKRKIVYDTSNNNWVTSMSLPRIQNYYIIYIPQNEYDALKPEYKREILI